MACPTLWSSGRGRKHGDSSLRILGGINVDFAIEEVDFNAESASR